MKSTCRFLESKLCKGKFGGSLAELPDSVREHVSQCDHCRELLITLQELESGLSRISKPAVSPESLRVIKSKILDRLESKNRSWFGWWLFRPVHMTGFAAAALIVLLMVHGLHRSPVNMQMTAPQTVLTQDAIDTIVFENTSLYDLDQSLMGSALLSQISENSINEIIDSVPPTHDWLYSDENFESLEEFTELDWDELRRYLS
jgi:hypothetical protein